MKKENEVDYKCRSCIYFSLVGLRHRCTLEDKCVGNDKMIKDSFVKIGDIS